MLSKHGLCLEWLFFWKKTPKKFIKKVLDLCAPNSRKTIQSQLFLAPFITTFTSIVVFLENILGIPLVYNGTFDTNAISVSPRFGFRGLNEETGKT